MNHAIAVTTINVQKAANKPWWTNDEIQSAIPITTLLFICTREITRRLREPSSWTDFATIVTVIIVSSILMRPFMKIRSRVRNWITSQNAALEPQYSARERLAAENDPRDPGFVGFDAYVFHVATYIRWHPITMALGAYCMYMIIGTVTAFTNHVYWVQIWVQITGCLLLLYVAADPSATSIAGWVSRRIRGARYANPSNVRPSPADAEDLTLDVGTNIARAVLFAGYPMALAMQHLPRF